jgi:hypothetical protein
MDRDYAGRPCQKRDPPHHPTLRPRDLAALDRVSSTKSCRNENALLQAARRARYGTRLRQTGGLTADQGRDPEPLYGPWNAPNSTRGMRPSKGGENLALGRVMQHV